MDKYDILKLDNQFCFSLYALSKEIVGLYKPLLDKLGLTYTQYITMLVLWERDGLSVKELGEKMALDSGTLTPLLKKLEQNNLVERIRQKDDERNVRITLTGKGKLLKEEALDIPKMMLEKMNISVEEIIETRDRLNRIYDAIKK